MKPFTKITSLILAIIALIHLARVLLGTKVLIDSFEAPMWISIVGFIIPTILSIGLWRESKR